MGSNRRKFIKEVTVCVAGIALMKRSSGAIPPLLNGYPMFHDPVKNSGIGQIFPFFSYCSKFNVGEYIPKDQGGKFIQMAVLGTEDDKKITELIRGGIIEEVYGNPIEWSRFELNEIEKSVWLNRFYFLPSFARSYYINGDRAYLDDMMGFITRWIKDNPRAPDSHKATANWRDMQVAWRSIHLSWCYYLGEKGLSEEEKKVIIDLQREHAYILLTGFGQQPHNEFNHQSHGALAMLYLGTLFPMLDGAEELRDKAIMILNHHLEKAFYSDGGNNEQMFGYYPFEAHIFRDAYLLCINNALRPPENTLLMLQKMAHYISSVGRPDGTMPQVNDSYEMPVQPSLSIINEVLENKALTNIKTSVLFPDSQVAVLKDGTPSKWFILCNAARVIGAHAHAGRLSFELWYDGVPVLIDSGCCNYDDPALVNWYRTSRAHNTVIIDGISDAATSSEHLWAPRRETLNKITKWMPGIRVSYLTMVSPAEEITNSSVCWKRTITLIKNHFAIISDTFIASGHHKYEILLHFPPAEVSKDDIKKTIRFNSEKAIDVIPVNADLINNITISDGMVSRNGISSPAPMAVISINGKDTVNSHLLVLPYSGNEAAKIKLKQNKNNTIMSIREADGSFTSISFTGNGISLVK